LGQNARVMVRSKINQMTGNSAKGVKYKITHYKGDYGVEEIDVLISDAKGCPITQLQIELNPYKGIPCDVGCIAKEGGLCHIEPSRDYIYNKTHSKTKKNTKEEIK